MLVWPGAGVGARGGGGGGVMKALGWLVDKPRVQSLPFLGGLSINPFAARKLVLLMQFFKMRVSHRELANRKHSFPSV